MSYEPPSPPANLPTELVNTLNEATSEHLRDVASYAETLAEHKEREARLEEEADDADVEERPDDLPDDVPAKATITIKEINDNRYYYWQWREGDQVKSKYALVKYIVGESENFSDNLFQCFSSRFAEDSSPNLERSEIRCQFVF